MMAMTLRQKLLANSVDGPNGCRLWTGAKAPWGYGAVRWQGKTRRAHRMAWLAEHGALPSPKVFICHSCDTPACINPAHLFAGSPMDNMRDARAKGRLSWHNVPFGARHGMSKLNVASVLRIRSDNRTAKVIAAELGVSKSTINLVKARAIWKHVA